MQGKRAVVFLNRFYWPDVAATGQMLTDLAEDLACTGWDVRVITSNSYYAVTGGTLPRREMHEGVRITRIAGTHFGRATIFGRLIDYASYVVGAMIAIAASPRGSIFVGLTDPPLIALIALLGARLKQGRAVYWVQDLFPDVAISLGTFREGGLVARTARSIARFVEDHCDLLIALGPAMKRRLEAHGVRGERVLVIHNWADSSSIRPVERSANPFVVEHGLGERFVVLYSGNAGRAHTFDAVIEAMRALSADDRFAFVFIGGGHRMPELREAVRQHSLRNVRFLDYVPRAQLAYSLSAASASLVTEDPRVIGQLVPSKTYAILASGRPIVFVGSAASDVATIINESQSGLAVAPDRPSDVIDALVALHDDHDLRRAMSRRARHAAESVFDRSIATRAWSEALATL
jgi:glycosyltransferase involved in cell wall biosynthesis